jgi:hypothetical protein
VTHLDREERRPRARDGRLLLDCRTLTDDEADEVGAAIAATRR